MPDPRISIRIPSDTAKAGIDEIRARLRELAQEAQRTQQNINTAMAQARAGGGARNAAQQAQQQAQATQRVTQAVNQQSTATRRAAQAQSQFFSETERGSGQLLRMRQRVQRFGDTQEQARRRTRGFGGAVENLARSVRGLEGPLGGTAARLQTLSAVITAGQLKAVALVGSITALAAATGILARQAIQSTLAMEQISRAMEFATGSASSAREEFEFLSDVSERLGLNLETSAQQFSKISAAARGTAIQTEELRQLFEGVASAGAVLSLSTSQVSGALNALTQIISKGTVQAEELRGQLGERIPGAFRIFADALDVTTAELNRMLEQGEVLAEDALPKFGDQLIETFGPSVSEATDRLGASIARLQNAVFEFGIAMDEAAGFSTAFQSGLDALTRTIRDITPNLSLVVQTVTTLGSILIGGALARGLLALATNFTAVATSVGTATAAMLGFTAAVRANPIGLAVTAIGALAGVIASLPNPLDKTTRAQSQLNEVLKEALDLTRQLETATGARRDKLAEQRRDIISQAEEELERQKQEIRAVTGFLDFSQISEALRARARPGLPGGGQRVSEITDEILRAHQALRDFDVETLRELGVFNLFSRQAQQAIIDMQRMIRIVNILKGGFEEVTAGAQGFIGQLKEISKGFDPLQFQLSRTLNTIKELKEEIAEEVPGIRPTLATEGGLGFIGPPLDEERREAAVSRSEEMEKVNKQLAEQRRLISALRTGDEDIVAVTEAMIDLGENIPEDQARRLAVQMVENEKVIERLQDKLAQPVFVPLAEDIAEAQARFEQLVRQRGRRDIFEPGTGQLEARGATASSEARQARQQSILALRQQVGLGRSLLGLTDDRAEIERQIAEFRLQHTDATDAEIKQFRELTEEASKLEKARQAARDIQQEAVDIASDITDFVTRGLTEGFEKGFEGLIDVIDRIFARIVARIAEKQIIVPITAQLVGAAPGLFGIQGAAAGAAGQTAGAGGLGQLLGSGLAGGGPLGGLLSTPLFGTGAVEAGTGAVAGGVTAGGLLGAGGLGFFGGRLLGGLVPGLNQTGSSIGGGLGAAAGLAFGGPLGAGIGGGIGSILGGLVGGLFGSDDNGISLGVRTQNRIGNINRRDPFERGVFARSPFGIVGLQSNLTEELKEDQLQKITSLIARVDEQTANLLTTAQEDAVREALVRDRGRKLRVGDELDESEVGSVIARRFRTIFQAIDEEIPRAIEVAIQQTAPTELVVSEALRALETIQAIRELERTGEPELSRAQQTLNQINEQFRQLSREAKDFGIAQSRVRRAQREAIENVRVGFTESIQQQILEITDPMQAALNEFDKTAERRLDDARTLGADLVEVERLNMLQRQEIIERFAEQTNRAIEQLLIEQTATREAPINIVDALANAQTRFRRLLGEAEERGAGGPELAESASNLLELLRERFASSQEFFTRRGSIIDALRQFAPGFQHGGSFSIPGGGGDNVVPLFRASGGETVRVERTDEQVEVLRGIGAEQTETNSLIRRLIAQIGELTNENAELSRRLESIERRRAS